MRETTYCAPWRRGRRTIPRLLWISGDAGITWGRLRGLPCDLVRWSSQNTENSTARNPRKRGIAPGRQVQDRYESLAFKIDPVQRCPLARERVVEEIPGLSDLVRQEAMPAVGRPRNVPVRDYVELAAMAKHRRGIVFAGGRRAVSRGE